MERRKEQQLAMALQELERRAASILELSNETLREEFISIAREETPTQTYEKAFDLAVQHFDARTARSFAKDTRFLAVIRRDYGAASFENLVAEA